MVKVKVVKVKESHRTATVKVVVEGWIVSTTTVDGAKPTRKPRLWLKNV
jgi:hypothetical protein